MEQFKTQREFNNKYPSGFYICPRCSSLTPDKYFCARCKNQSNNLIWHGYKVAVADVEELIFNPVETKKEGAANVLF